MSTPSTPFGTFHFTGALLASRYASAPLPIPRAQRPATSVRPLNGTRATAHTPAHAFRPQVDLRPRPLNQPQPSRLAALAEGGAAPYAASLAATGAPEASGHAGAGSGATREAASSFVGAVESDTSWVYWLAGGVTVVVATAIVYSRVKRG